MNRLIAVRLGLLAAIVIAGLYYTWFDVLQYRMGTQPYDLTVAMPRAGGLYPGGFVTYRGVDIGRISALDLTAGGVQARLAINPGVRIPGDSAVSIHDLSALGEEYLDFVPRSDRPPYLSSHSRISVASGAEPVQVSQLLSDASRFSNSIDTYQVSTLLTTATQALSRSGPALQQVLTASRGIFADLQQVQPQTVADIVGGQTLLRTGQATNPDIRSYAGQLAQLSQQVKASTPDIQALFTNGAAGTAQLQALLSADSGPLTRLTGLGQSLTAVTAGNQPAVQALLVALPTFANDAGSLYYNGTVNGQFFLNPGYLPICTYSSAPLPLPTAPPPPADLSATCHTTAPNLLQRGAANAPEVHP